MKDEWNQARQTCELAMSEQTFVLPRMSLLEGFAELISSSRGVDLTSLAVNDAIQVSTENSEYRIVLLDPIILRVEVQGGDLFAKPTQATVRGATAGGSMIKIGWITVGLQVELVYYPAGNQMQSVLTSPVKTLSLERVRP